MKSPARLLRVGLALALATTLAGSGQKPAEPAHPAAGPASATGAPALDTDDEKVVNVYNWSD